MRIIRRLIIKLIIIICNRKSIKFFLMIREKNMYVEYKMKRNITKVNVLIYNNTHL